MNKLLAVACLSAAIVFADRSATAQEATLELIGHLSDENYTEGQAISGDGEAVVGLSAVAEGLDAFYWTKATGMLVLMSDCQGTCRISRDGSTAYGTQLYYDEEFDQIKDRYFRGLPGSGSFLASPNPELIQEAGCCSADGSVFYASDYDAGEGDVLYRWNDEGFDEFPVEGLQWVYDCSDDGSIVYGVRSVFLSPMVFRWTEEDGVDDLFSLGLFAQGGTRTYAACSASGEVFVGSNQDLPSRAFRWTDATGRVNLPFPKGLGPNPQSTANACSADGKIIAGYAWGDDDRGPCVWIDGDAFLLERILKDRGVSTAGWSLNAIDACSADGTVFIGSGADAESTTATNVYRADIVNRKRPNDPPVARAGKNVVVTTASRDGARVRLDGRDSFDPDGDPLSFLWTADGIRFDDKTARRPLALFPVGRTTVKLRVVDGKGKTDTDTVDVTVRRQR